MPFDTKGEEACPGRAGTQLPRPDTSFISGIDYIMLVFKEHCASKYVTTGSPRTAQDPDV